MLIPGLKTKEKMSNTLMVLTTCQILLQGLHIYQLIEFSQHPTEVGAIFVLIPILQMR